MGYRSTVFWFTRGRAILFGAVVGVMRGNYRRDGWRGGENWLAAARTILDCSSLSAKNATRGGKSSRGRRRRLAISSQWRPLKIASRSDRRGPLHYDIATHGKLAHSAYPELVIRIHALLEFFRTFGKFPFAARRFCSDEYSEYRTISGAGRRTLSRMSLKRKSCSGRWASRQRFAKAVSLRRLLAAAEARECCTLGSPTSKFDGSTYHHSWPQHGHSDVDGAWGQPFPHRGPGSIHVAPRREAHLQEGNCRMR